MNVTYEMVVDFARPYKNHTVLVMQDDHLSRICHFILRSNGKALDVSDVVGYKLMAITPESDTVHDSGTLDTDGDTQLNEITYEIPQALTEATGTCTCTITLTSSSGAVLQSFEFYIRARNELKNENEDSEEDLAGFRDILTKATTAIEKIEALTNKSSLPNPYELRMLFGETAYTYDGSKAVSVKMADVYLSDEKIETTPITWTS